MKKTVLCLILCGLLTACGHEGMQIQKDYVADRDECREYAEMTASGRNNMQGGGLPSGRQHVMLVAQFARCMNKRGWAVNKPPAEVTEEAKRSSVKTEPARKTDSGGSLTYPMPR